MNIKVISAVAAIATIVSSCFDKNDNIVTFSHDDFQVQKTLKGEQIAVPTILSPNEMYVMHDSLVLVCNTNPGMKKKIGLYNLNTWNLLGEFAVRGHANDEFIDCSVVPSVNSNIFFLKDMQKAQFWICDIDLLSYNKPCAKSQFYYSRNAMDIYPLDSTYIGFNFWYLNDEKYDNNVPSIAEYSMKSHDDGKLKKSYDYFVANVTGGIIFRNPKNHEIWVAYRHDNTIEIYDDLLHLKRVMHGPNYKKNTYATQKFSHQEVVMFTSESYTSCYSGYYATDNYVYLIYENITCDKFPQKPKPVEILKFDWNGNCISNYKLDKFAYTISVNSKENILYATCCDENNGEVQFYKYRL